MLDTLKHSKALGPYSPSKKHTKTYISARKTYHKKLHVQMVILMMDT